MTDAERHRTVLEEMRDDMDINTVLRREQHDAITWALDALRAQEEARELRFQAAQSCNGPTVYYDPGDGDLQPVWGWDDDDPAGEQWAQELAARLNAVVVVPTVPTGAERVQVDYCVACSRLVAIGRAYLAFWADGTDEAAAALRRAQERAIVLGPHTQDCLSGAAQERRIGFQCRSGGDDDAR
jgi:hypothetical protein